jgi:prepilin-type N-terminal cleavage/methylation domain-containing protein
VKKYKVSHLTKRDIAGLTLIELLLVIAIISIVGSIVLTGLKDVRTKARRTVALSSLRGVRSAALVCLNDRVDLNSSGGQPIVGDDVCTGSNTTWPALPANWFYINTFDAGSLTCDNDPNVSDSRFEYCAATFTGELAGIACNETSCRQVVVTL